MSRCLREDEARRPWETLPLKDRLLWRARRLAQTRAWLSDQGFVEVDPPALVALPGLEPQIDPFALHSLRGQPLYLHTSPEYAMKRLLAAGMPKIYALGHVFRDEPRSITHSPEFTMLEFYLPGGEQEVMAALEALLRQLAQRVDQEGAEIGASAAGGVFLERSYDRLGVRAAFQEATGVDLLPSLLSKRPDRDQLAAALEARGLLQAAADEGWDDLYFRAFLDHVEPGLGRERPVFLTDYPAHMASLSKLREDDPRFARRFELYAAGVELANGFAELADGPEQRRRLVAEQAERRQAGRPVYPLDEAFLSAVDKLPETGGVALGFDRLLMLLAGASRIDAVQPFPFSDYPSVNS